MGNLIGVGGSGNSILRLNVDNTRHAGHKSIRGRNILPLKIAATDAVGHFMPCAKAGDIRTRYGRGCILQCNGSWHGGGGRDRRYARQCTTRAVGNQCDIAGHAPEIIGNGRRRPDQCCNGSRHPTHSRITIAKRECVARCNAGSGHTFCQRGRCKTADTCRTISGRGTFKRRIGDWHQRIACQLQFTPDVEQCNTAIGLRIGSTGCGTFLRLKDGQDLHDDDRNEHAERQANHQFDQRETRLI